MTVNSLTPTCVNLRRSQESATIDPQLASVAFFITIAAALILIGIPFEVLAQVPQVGQPCTARGTSNDTWMTSVMQSYVTPAVKGGMQGIQWIAYTGTGLGAAAAFATSVVTKQPPTANVLKAGGYGVGAGASGSLVSGLMGVTCAPASIDAFGTRTSWLEAPINNLFDIAATAITAISTFV
jgi:hypothetical protein